MNSPHMVIPPLPLSPVHQSSIMESEALDTRVSQFLKHSLQIPMMQQSQKLSSGSSLENSRTYFQSEINYLTGLVKQTNKLYQGKQHEVMQMKAKMKEYQEKIFQLQHEEFQHAVVKCKKGIEKWKRDEAIERENKNDDVKTRKKTVQHEEDTTSNLHMPVKSSISSFQFVPNSQSSNKSTSSKHLHSSRLQHQNVALQRVKHQLQCKLQAKSQQNYKQQVQLQQAKLSISSYKRQLAQTLGDKEKIVIEYKILKNRYQSLQKQYHLLEDNYGKEITEGKITIENLRQVLRGIHESRSPKKKSKKLEEGYYSINRLIKRNQSSDSLSSSEASLPSQSLSYCEDNLREQNEFLRTELIKAFDQKEAVKRQLNKHQKIMEKLESQQQAKGFKNHRDQNCLDLSNLSSDDKLASKIFKKNKASTVLVVENTQKKEKQIVEEHKISNLLEEISELIEILNGKPNEISEILLSRPVLLDNMVKKLNICCLRHKETKQLLETVQSENGRLKRKIFQLEEKFQKDLNLGLLKEVAQNPSQNSIDSTDQTFKNIQLEEVSTSAKIFTTKQQQYLQLIQDQQAQILQLRNRIISLQEVSESFYRLTSQSSSHINASLPRGNEMVPANSVVSQPVCCDDHILELSSFQMFKQKLTEFYQHTIKELDNWETTALVNGHSSVKKLPQIKSEVYEPTTYQIPHIVQRNILKISREFRSKDDISDEEKSQRNQKLEEDLFMNQMMSKSFMSEQKHSQTLEEIINKRLDDFQQFSSDWIQKVISKVPAGKDSSSMSDKAQDQTLKQQAVDCPSARRMQLAMTERPSVQRQRNFEVDMNEIDARSESMTSQQLTRERQLFIREEISYYLPRNDSTNRMLSSSKKSYQSFRI